MSCASPTVSSSAPCLSDHRILKLRFSPSSDSSHHVFFRPHRVRDPCAEKPNLRTLMLSNVPPWCPRAAIRRIFGDCGPVEEVFFQRAPSSGPPPRQDGDPSLRTGFRFAYVVFERPSSVGGAMRKMDLVNDRSVLKEKSSSKARSETESSSEAAVGMDKWRMEYNESLCLDTEALEGEIEEGVADLDKAKEEAEKRVLDDAEEEAEDGWVTVTRHTSRKPVGGASGKAQARVKAREARKRKRKELENFYLHQMKEKKLRRIDELREKFQRDRQRQQDMRAERKFRPQK